MCDIFMAIAITYNWLKKKREKLVTVAYVSHSSTQEVEAKGAAGIQEQPGLL